jgi:hypothetical protein
MSSNRNVIDIVDLILRQNSISISENKCPGCGYYEWFCYKNGDSLILLKGYTPLIDMDEKCIIDDCYSSSCKFDECVNCGCVVS